MCQCVRLVKRACIQILDQLGQVCPGHRARIGNRPTAGMGNGTPGLRSGLPVHAADAVVPGPDAGGTQREQRVVGRRGTKRVILVVDHLLPALGTPSAHRSLAQFGHIHPLLGMLHLVPPVDTLYFVEDQRLCIQCHP